MDTRAYIRVFVDRADRWADLTDIQYRALDLLHMHAVEQLPRGWYRSLAVAQAFLPPRFAEAVPSLIDLGMIVLQADGRLYLVGWTEDQEGDWQVAERVRRHRAVQRGHLTPDPATPPTVTPVTPASVNTPRTPAMHKTRDKGQVTGDGGTTPPADSSWDDFGPEWDAVRAAWTARGLPVPPKGTKHDERGTSQRAILHEILADWPGELPKWIARAPAGASAYEVVRYCTQKLGAVRASVPPDPPQGRPKGALTPISTIIPSMQVVER